MLRKKNYPQFLWLLFCATNVLADHATVTLPGKVGGPITTVSANTLGIGKISTSLQYQYIDFEAVDNRVLSQAAEDSEDVHSTDSLQQLAYNFSYGISDNLTLGVSIPYIERKGLKGAIHRHDDATEAHEELVVDLGNSTGPGDTHFYASYQFRTNSIAGNPALLFGVKAPTGVTDEISPAGDLLEVEYQPGSGSWDTFLGLAYSRQAGKWTVDTNILYTFVTGGSQITTFGDIFNYNLSLSYPLTSNEQHGHSQSGVTSLFVFELNGEWRDQTEIAGQSETHSGGNLLYLSPGLVMNMDKWSLGVSVAVPLTNLQGIQSSPDTRVLVQLGLVF